MPRTPLGEPSADLLMTGGFPRQAGTAPKCWNDAVASA